MRSAADREEPILDAERSLSFVPVRIGVQPLGSIGISGPILSRKTLEALGTLVAIASERARAVEGLGKAEAVARRRAIAIGAARFGHPRFPHAADFHQGLGHQPALDDDCSKDLQLRELLTIIDEESDRLNQLVGDAAEMARLDAGEFELKLEPHPISEIVAAAVAQCRPFLGNAPGECEPSKPICRRCAPISIASKMSWCA